jgi:hypothetical protein
LNGINGRQSLKPLRGIPALSRIPIMVVPLITPSNTPNKIPKMWFGAKITVINGSWRVVKPIDDDLACLSRVRPWNPWHLLGLLTFWIRMTQSKQANEWWLCDYNDLGTDETQAWEQQGNDDLSERTPTDSGQD